MTFPGPSGPRRLRLAAICAVVATVAGPAPIGAAQEEPARTDSVADWEAGQRLLESGDWRGALEVWEDARDRLAGDGLHDPRIGISFIETATEREVEELYGDASTFYLWGLGTPSVEGSEEALRQELDRLRLIWSDDEAARFDSIAARGLDGVRLAIKRYWIERDPTPASDENERLIEHWERIREARRRFTYNRSTPIGTDDRGIVYLKFGPPDNLRNGSLGASEFELRVRVPTDLEARARLRGYDTNPQYELWKYEGLNDEGFTFFLFGNVDGTGPFERVETVTDLIPPAALSRNSARFTPGGIPAGFYLELFYYQDLSILGGHFGQRFSELERRWDQATYDRGGYLGVARQVPTEGSLEALRYRFEQEDRYDPPFEAQVPIRSQYEGTARDEMVAQMMRTLSDDGVPLVVLVGTSAPRFLSVRDEDDEFDLEFPEWVMRHTLVIRDGQMDEVGRLVQPVSAERADVSSFVLRHVPEPLHLTMTARTLRISEDLQDTLVVGSRLPGQRHFEPGEPLPSDSATFTVSDLLTGTPIPPGIRPDLLPYPILPATTIWRRDPLRVYVETFNAGEYENGRASLDVRFVVIPLDEDGEADLDRDPVSLSVNLAPRAGIPYRESFDMQLRDQELGRYRVVLEITDRARGAIVTRSSEIELVR